MLNLQLEEMLLLKNIIVEIKEVYRHQGAHNEFVKIAVNLPDLGRLNEISHKLSDEIRVTMQPLMEKELKHG